MDIADPIVWHMSSMRVSVRSSDRLFADGLSSIVAAAAPALVISTFEPDILLLDSRTDDVLAMCAQLRRETGATVILIAAPDDDDWAARAIGAGARGILLTDATAADVVKAIHAVNRGEIWAPRRVLSAVLDLLTSVPNGEYGVAIIEHSLSARERQVFRHAATGLANKEVAVRLGVSEATVKMHLTHIFHKLGLHCRSELAAAFHGLVSPATST